jgi:hypothetical protein
MVQVVLYPLQVCAPLARELGEGAVKAAAQGHLGDQQSRDG